MLAKKLGINPGNKFLTLVSKENDLRLEVEQFIQQCFSRKFGVKIRHFSDELFCAHDSNGEMVGAFSMTRACDAKLYVEQYLDEDVECLCSASAGRRVARDDIVEIGSMSLASSSWFVPIMRAALSDRRMDVGWAIFTATDAVQGMLNREKIYPQVLTLADQECLTDSRNDWGSYYAYNPCVYLVSLNRLRRTYINSLRTAKRGAGRG